MAEERLQKVMARAGLGSRRACEGMIQQQRVVVNGEVATLGLRVDPARDEIRVDGVRLPGGEGLVYVMVNKPRYVISDEDPRGEHQSVRDLVPLPGRLYSVGRLDLESEGLVLLTNDGDLAHKLTHPRYEHSKTYHVLVEGSPSEKTLDAWRRGVILDGRRTAPAEVRRLGKEKGAVWLEAVIREGRKRQIRRVAAMLGHPVRRLIRVGLGPLELGDLEPGAWRQLSAEEAAALRSIRESSPRRPPRSQRRSPRSEDGTSRGSRPRKGRSQHRKSERKGGRHSS